MPTARVQNFLDSAWVPLLYTAADISDALGVTEAQAERWIKQIAGDREVVGVSHHDLKELLGDSPIEAPFITRLNPGEVWLQERGWVLHTSYRRYRWSHPEKSPRVRFTTALDMELRASYEEEQEENEPEAQFTEISYYDILAVSRNCTIAELMTSFRALVRTCHPDLFQNASSDEKAALQSKFITIREAFDTLKDPVKRAEYDLTLRQGFNADDLAG